ncbi:unnamed protein product [Echinostoma caproni]|uniref:CYTOSOL_AP domain-containing protein n=1 Tax=Echinostoma caproni TaxID=27848 RepID=A0A183BEG6_9TREM|nr:unnamed protein product [Echinostoma caproni]
MFSRFARHVNKLATIHTNLPTIYLLLSSIAYHPRSIPRSVRRCRLALRDIFVMFCFVDPYDCDSTEIKLHVGERVFTPNPRTIYGGELMAQALIAASKTVGKDLKPHSLHCYFHDRGMYSECVCELHTITVILITHSTCSRLIKGKTYCVWSIFGQSFLLHKSEWSKRGQPHDSKIY